MDLTTSDSHIDTDVIIVGAVILARLVDDADLSDVVLAQPRAWIDVRLGQVTEDWKLRTHQA